MNEVMPNPTEVAERARKMMEADVERRVEAVRVAAAAIVEVGNAEQRVRDATASYDAAFRAAVGTGWSEKDLRAAGLRAPASTAGRSRRRRSPAPEEQLEPSA